MGCVMSYCIPADDGYITLRTNAPYFDRYEENIINYEMLCSYYR